MAYKYPSDEKECRRKHYEKYKEDYKRRARERTKRMKDTLDSLKSSGCEICGEKFPQCLEFHHLNPSQKEFTVSQLRLKGNLRKMKDEISKCILLCANCHRKVHYGLIQLPIRAD